MKKYIVFIAALALLLSGCVKKQIFMPLPVTLEETITFNADPNGNFNEMFIYSAEEITDAVNDKLDELEEFINLNNVNIEGVQITLVNTNAPNTTISGQIDVQYGGLGPLTLLNMSNLNLGQILNQPQSLNLDPAGVQIIRTAMQEIILSQIPINDLVVITSGSGVSSTSSLTFDIKFEVTVSVVVDQCQEIFDMFGTEDPDCE